MYRISFAGALPEPSFTEGCPMDAIRTRDAVLEMLLDAYEDAGVRGLCGEGRWEAAIGTVRSLPEASILQWKRRPESLSTPSSGDAMSWKPDGYQQAIPYLIVDGAAASMEFLGRAFDAREVRNFPTEDGRVMHAEVRIGDSVLMLADGNEGWPPVGAHVYLYLPDVDEAYRRALDAGAESVQEPVRKEDEDRRAAVRDAGGTTWWIATREGSSS